jgi:hypothetical protein
VAGSDGGAEANTDVVVSSFFFFPFFPLFPVLSFFFIAFFSSRLFQSQVLAESQPEN